jgi:tRNA A37 threonylcarbamoyladenosine synthetase subunit TsaC/SUA5/YrdC
MKKQKQEKLTKEQRVAIVEKLKNNEILILPTDTIYGLSMKVQGNQPIVLNSLKKAA